MSPADALRAFGLTYPGAALKSPWPEHLDLAVKDKTFAYLSVEGEPLKISCKLPQTGMVALELPFTQPTGYGLGKSGWVSARFEAGEAPPVELLRAWIDESYRAVAPKTMVARLPAAPTAGAKAGVSATAPRTGPKARPRSGKKSSRSTATGR